MEQRDPQPTADRVDAVARRLDRERLLHLCEFVGHLGGEVVGLRPVLGEVVEAPLVVVGGPLLDAGRLARDPRQPRAGGGGHPAVVVDRAAAHDLEVLGSKPSVGRRVVEGVGQADAVYGVLGDAVDHQWRSDPDDFVDGGDDVVAVMEL